MPSTRVARRLCAIMAIDMVGYSRLMGEDEVGTLEALKSHRQQLVEPTIRKHEGRTLKLMGDGALVEFASAVNAVDCAVEIQRSMSGNKFQLRIGVNIGDVIVEGDDLYGDGINIAARLEAMAEPGGVLVSQTVYEHVRKKTPLTFRDLGEREAKNISEPLRLFQVEVQDDSVERDKGSASVLERPAVAVLPFLNISGDPEQDYFVDGLTEDIITALSYWRTFPVIARNSTFSYKGKSIDVRKIAEELGARFVLEGSVRKAGNRVRVTAQLIDSFTGHHFWGKRYDGDLTDIFELQDQLTQQIAAVVEPAITRAERKRIVSSGTQDTGAWDYFLRGTALMYQFNKTAHQQARAMFERALQIDPAYCQANVSIAFTYLQGISLKMVDDHEVAVAETIASARKAIALDDDDSGAHLCLGLAHMWSHEYDPAIAEVRRAIECNPSNALAYIILGNVIDVAGDPEEGIPYLETGLKLNPLNPRIHHALTWLGGAYLNARRYKEALDWLERAAQGRSDYPLTHLFRAICLANLDRVSEAQDSLAECERIEPGFVAEFVRWKAYKKQSDNLHMLEGVRRAGFSK